MLGSLIIGVPARTFSSISGTQLLTASKDPSFVGNILTASQVVQQTVVVQVFHFLQKFQNIKVHIYLNKMLNDNKLIFQEKLLILKNKLNHPIT